MTRTQKQPSVSVWTDGGCSPNPGPGGWGVVIVAPRGRTLELCGGERHTTNNRMEMTAVLRGLERMPDGAHVVVYSDSKYVVNGLNQWIAAWQKRGWKTKSGAGVKNRGLWIALAAERKRLNVRAKWVRGHAGTEHNERAHELASQGRLEL